MTHLVYLSLGTNMGNKEENLRTAMTLIEEQVGTITSQSALYASAPWGFDSENTFLNNAISVETSLTPEELQFCSQHFNI